MLSGRCFGVWGFVAALILVGSASASDQGASARQVRPETVAKLISQLGADDFRSREEATAKLEKLGDPILPQLRKAIKENTELEIKRRIELVVRRIEKALLEAEEKQWIDLDARRRALKDRLLEILRKTPSLGEQQVASAVYLLTTGRSPTENEAARARKQLTESNSRSVVVLRVARSLIQGKEFAAELAASNERLLEVRKDVAGEGNLVKRLARLNGDEFQKICSAITTSLEKSVKSDERFADATFLLVLSRFPTETESKTVLAYLKKAKKRAEARSDLFWALMNSKEFLVGPR